MTTRHRIAALMSEWGRSGRISGCIACRARRRAVWATGPPGDVSTAPAWAGIRVGEHARNSRIRATGRPSRSLRVAARLRGECQMSESRCPAPTVPSVQVRLAQHATTRPLGSKSSDARGALQMGFSGATFRSRAVRHERYARRRPRHRGWSASPRYSDCEPR